MSNRHLKVVFELICKIDKKLTAYHILNCIKLFYRVSKARI